MLWLDTPRYRKVGPQLRLTSHLISNTSLEELHAFAAQLGLPPRAFHDKPGAPHYDLLDGRVPQAVRAGAVAVSTRVLLGILRRHPLAKTDPESPDAPAPC